MLSARTKGPPRLIEWIRRSGLTPERFVIERLLWPYVNVVSYLLFEQGIATELHTQNLLFQVTTDGELTGKIALRDLSDASVNVPLRVARGKELPDFERGFLPARMPFFALDRAADYGANARRSRILRGYDAVDRYGLWGFLWPVNEIVRRHYPRYDVWRMQRIFLGLFQRACVSYLGVRPLVRARGPGLAIDEAIAYFLEHADWTSLGAVASRAPPAEAVPLLIGGRPRRGKGVTHARIETSWGDLWIAGRMPAYFRPGF